MENHRANFRHLVSQAHLLTWLHKSSESTSLLCHYGERHCRHHHHPAASPSFSNAPSIAPREERAGINQWQAIADGSSWNSFTICCRLISGICIISKWWLLDMGLSGQNFCSPLCLWRNWVMSYSKFCRRNQEFAEPLCSHRNPDSKGKQPEMAGFGCSPTKKAIPSYQPPIQEQKKKKLLWKGLPHTQAVWGWPNTRIK